jgi:hypothetical protein
MNSLAAVSANSRPSLQTELWVSLNYLMTPIFIGLKLGCDNNVLSSQAAAYVWKNKSTQLPFIWNLVNFFTAVTIKYLVI